MGTTNGTTESILGSLQPWRIEDARIPAAGSAGIVTKRSRLEEITTVSRVPRSLEHLKTGFTAEAVSAARYRAFASHAENSGKPNLARRWLELAAQKDALAILQLQAAGQVRADQANVGDALAEKRFENDVLYPKLLRAVDEETASVFQEVASYRASSVRVRACG